MRVLFTHAYFLRLDPKQWKAAKPYPPLGTLYALAAARNAGHDARFFDAMFARGGDAIGPVLEAIRPDALVIHDDSFNFLTKMCLEAMRDEALGMAARGRAMGATVVVASSDAADHPELYLRAGADFVLLGDAEETLVELLDALGGGDRSKANAVVGIARLDGGALSTTGRRRSPNPLDALPSPAWDVLDVAPYERMWRRRGGRFSMNLVASRGCPYGCDWCAKPLFGRQYVAHSPARVVDDVLALRRRFAPEHVWFGDDIFGLTAEWTREFGDVVERRGARIPFTIQTRADLIVKDDLRAGLVRAGLETAWLGAESGSQKILDAMNKGLRVEDTREAAAKLKRDGVRVGLFLQFGYLGETRKDIDLTLALVEDIAPDEIGVSVSYPLPGTPFHAKARAEAERAHASGSKTNWRHSDDLDLLFPGSFAPEYYRRLHRYVHHVFQTRRGRDAWRALLRDPARLTRSQWKAAAFIPFHAPAARFDAWALGRQER